MHGITLYITTLSIIAFVMFGIDKYKAKHNQWRIPEATLLGIAILGGSLGAFLGMKIWHHKTLHPQFKYGIPAIIVIQVCLLVWLES